MVPVDGERADSAPLRLGMLAREQLVAIVENISDIIAVVDENADVKYISPTVLRLLGYSPDSPPPTGAFRLVHPDDKEAAFVAFAEALSSPGVHAPVLVRMAHADGSWRHCEIVANNMLADPSVRGVILDMRDVTQRVTAQQQFELLLESAPDAMVIVDADGRITLVNRQTERLFGYERDELVDQPVEVLIPKRFVAAHRPHRQAYADDPRPRPMGAGFDLFGRRKDGTEFPVEISLSPLQTDAGMLVSAAIRDVTERKELEEQLVHQALHDPLTRLPNRALLMDRIDHALRRSRRSLRTVAVLFLDIDRFKLINDSRGHVIGDGILNQVAARLSRVVRASDTVARFGGDEFVVVTEVQDRSEVAHLGARLLTAFDGVMALEGTEAFVTASLGISIARPDSTPDSLVREADAAMYHAKARGPGRVEFFDESIRVQAARRLETENALHRAIDRDELRVRYQPIVAVDSGELVATEALLRWRHPDRGLLYPADFMAVAEDTGLVDRIGMWVLRAALRQLKAWGVDDSLLIAVNLSAHQLRDPGLTDMVAAELEQTGMAPTSLVFEITESVLVGDGELVTTALNAIHALKRIGVRLALDDFGTGYSSLGRLKRLPVDELKIDREFVRGLGTDRHDSAIVSATLTMAEELNLAVVAEGVETQEQLEHLRALGCPLAQGFLFAEPLPPAQFAELLQRSPHDRSWARVAG